nr:tetratricopeptide repeat protein [Chitinophagaceae bacterium]
AGKQFQESARASKDKSFKSQANHNVGNTFLEQKKWDDAIQYYKQSLRENPNSPNTKYNLAYAQKMKQQQDQQQNKDKNKQDKQDQKDQQKKDQQPKDDQQKQDQKDKQDQQKNKPDQPKEEQKPQPQPSKLTKEQADQLLNALNQEEKKLKEKKEKGQGQPVKLDKDW